MIATTSSRVRPFLPEARAARTIQQPDNLRKKKLTWNAICRLEAVCSVPYVYQMYIYAA